MGNLFAELKRRHIYRAGAAYAIAAFGLIEIVSNVAPMFDLPAWVGRALVLVLITGFPVTLLAAWMIESKAPDAAPATAKVDYVLAGAVMIVIGLMVYERFAPRSETSAPPQPAATAAPADGVSIAVLPFVNLSSDPEQEFFSDGMTEEITSALAKVKGLQVVGRTSAFEFKGQNKDLRAIGQALGATNLLEGSVRKAGNRVRITGQLIRADNGRHIWTENYDRELTDIFATQDDIARAIAAALQIPLGLSPGQSLVDSREVSSESYSDYLHANALYRSRRTIGAKPLTEAAGLLDQIVARDPNYAPAWALMGKVYSVLTQELQDGFRSLEEYRRVADLNLTKAEAAGRRAIELAPGNADSYVGAANPIVFRGSFAKMEDLYRQALKLDPLNPDALHGLSQQLAGLGRLKEAVPMRQQLRLIDPFAPKYNLDTAGILSLAGQRETAIDIAKALPLNYSPRASFLARLYAEMGRFPEAAETIQSAPVGNFNPDTAAAVVRLLKLAPANVPPKDLPELRGPLAFAYVFVGAPERLFEDVLSTIERDANAGYRTYQLSALLTQPRFASVRRSTRFKALLRQDGHVDYWRARGWPDMCHPVGADDFECS